MGWWVGSQIWESFPNKGLFLWGASLIMCDRRDIDTIRHIGRAVRFV